MELLVVLTLVSAKPTGFINNLLLPSSYLTINVVVMPDLTSILIVSPSVNPCVSAVATVAVFLTISPVMVSV